MTQPKFPWALLLIIAMFTFVAVSAPTLWLLGFAVVAVIVSTAAAIYQYLPRKDPSIAVEPKPGEESELDDFVDPWVSRSDDGDPEEPDPQV